MVPPRRPTKTDGEWRPPSSSEIGHGPEPGSATISGSPRIDVISPAGKAWWRDVEMTAYLKYESVKTTDPSQAPHWTFYARGERHTSSTTVADPKTINGGVLAPVGTATWPGYPFTGTTSIDARCLGSSIKGAIYPDGHGWWKKEISHTEGYTASRPPPNGVVAAPFSYATDQLVTWAGPNVTFRVDNLVYDFKWASAREIEPLP